ncbi:hypothetical protein [Wolbachia endosymbiont (group A) of Tiphia femorata]|nr:hypothetical protein [Wolbachia endosymbiont (group A) of Tiphia femorata]
MQYYIKEENWKQILEFIKSVKGIVNLLLISTFVVGKADKPRQKFA